MSRVKDLRPRRVHGSAARGEVTGALLGQRAASVKPARAVMRLERIKCSDSLTPRAALAYPF
jgi:hypothetical protein